MSGSSLPDDFFKIIEEAPGTVLDEIGDQFETIFAPAVGIRDFGMGVMAAVVGEAADFRLLLRVGCQGFDVGPVFLIHGDDEVEMIKVGSLQAAGCSGHGIAASAQDSGHGGVGAFSALPVDGAGGVTGELFGEVGPGDEMAEDIFAGRRAADVAKANEEDFVRAFHGTNGRKGSPKGTAKR